MKTVVVAADQIKAGDYIQATGYSWRKVVSAFTDRGGTTKIILDDLSPAGSAIQYPMRHLILVAKPNADT